jgi:hypothetical protein
MSAATRRRGSLRVPLLALLVLLGACGWRSGLPLPPDADSVGVELFDPDPDVYERGLEPLLHEQLTRSVSDLVALPLRSPERADLVVRGRILEYRRRSGVRNEDNQLLESGVRVVIEAELVERTTGRRLGSSARVALWSGHALDSPANEGAARDRALHNLAERVVLDLFQGAERIPESNPDTAGA